MAVGAAIAIVLLFVFALRGHGFDRYAFLKDFNPQKASRDRKEQRVALATGGSVVLPARTQILFAFPKHDSDKVLPALIRELTSKGFVAEPFNNTSRSQVFSKVGDDLVYYSEDMNTIYRDTASLPAFQNDLTGCIVRIFHKPSWVEQKLVGIRGFLHLN